MLMGKEFKQSLTSCMVNLQNQLIEIEVSFSDRSRKSMVING